MPEAFSYRSVQPLNTIENLAAHAVSAFSVRPLAIVLAAMLIWNLLAIPACAQVNSASDPYRVVATVPSPYWGYTFTPYAASLHGATAVMHAHGEFLIKTQEARLLREKVRQVKLETRRAELEQWVWEREFLADFRDRERQRIREAEVERARTLPPITEILAAVSLNNLFDELVTRPPLPAAKSTPVEAEWLAHVNVTVDGRGNAGLLRNERLFWPQLLLHPGFDQDREQIEQMLASAKRAALETQQNPQPLMKLRARVADCRKRMVDEIRRDDAWSPRHYIEANKLMRELEDAINILERPEAIYLLSPLRGKTVAELVTHMKTEGVRFAAATSGGERAYAALHRAMADEVTRQKAQR